MDSLKSNEVNKQPMPSSSTNRSRSRSPKRVESDQNENENLQNNTFPQSASSRCLTYTLEAQDGRARAATILLPHGPVETPVFMPVGTQGTIKGLHSSEVEELGPQIILGNTYHLANRPGIEILGSKELVRNDIEILESDKNSESPSSSGSSVTVNNEKSDGVTVGNTNTKSDVSEHPGLHKFMQWNRNILTDSGGFQMVSLLKLAQINEEGVEFDDPKNPGSKMLLTPEESIKTQNVIGSDIMMQLDDVVSSMEPDKERVREATDRTTRWLDRCIKAHQNPDRQNLFAIVQGGLHEDLRRKSLNDLKQRGDSCPGYAIGGLSGGEEKDQFWKVVGQCTDEEKDGLPRLKPRYCMGVGYSLDIVVCVALGVDMFDCVYPCRTARFGTALTRKGQLRLGSANKFNKNSDSNDSESNSNQCNGPIESDCDCYTCKNYTRQYLSTIVAKNDMSNSSASTLITIHNIRYMMRLMSDMRTAIKAGTFSEWVISFLKKLYSNNDDETVTVTDSKFSDPETKIQKKQPQLLPPVWVKNALFAAKIRGIETAFDWANGIHSTDDMPKCN